VALIRQQRRNCNRFHNLLPHQLQPVDVPGVDDRPWDNPEVKSKVGEWEGVGTVAPEGAGVRFGRQELALGCCQEVTLSEG